MHFTITLSPVVSPAITSELSSFYSTGHGYQVLQNRLIRWHWSWFKMLKKCLCHYTNMSTLSMESRPIGYYSILIPLLQKSYLWSKSSLWLYDKTAISHEAVLMLGLYEAKGWVESLHQNYRVLYGPEWYMVMPTREVILTNLWWDIRWIFYWDYHSCWEFSCFPVLVVDSSIARMMA